MSFTESDILDGIPGYDPRRSAGECTFDIKRAAHAIDFFPLCLQLVEGEKGGSPFHLERWQAAIVGNLFGWYRPNGFRRYREALLFVARKNGKTPLAAGIILYMLFTDKEPGNQIYGAAHDFMQASLVFRHAKAMVMRNPSLRAACKVFDSQTKAITIEDRMSAYRVISGKPEGKHGLNISLAVVDELHEFKDRELLDAIDSSTASRRQPLLIYMTTSDYERPESPCNEKHKYACNVRDGAVDDPAFLPVIYEVLKTDDWNNEEVWKKANPNLGISVSFDYLRRAYKKAKEAPHSENVFRRFHLNQRTEQASRFINVEKWIESGGIIDVPSLAGRLCYAGLDLASNKDLNAMVLAFQDGAAYKILPFFWCPRDGAEQRSRTDRVPYLAWAQAGFLRLTDGDTTDYDLLRKEINEIRRLYAVQEIAVDAKFQGRQLAQQLVQDGCDVITFSQSALAMTAPTNEFERLYLEGRIIHGNNPVMNWMAGNVAVEKRGDMIKPSKAHSGDRIDGIVASIMAIARAMVNASPLSVYERGDVPNFWSDDDVDSDMATAGQLAP